MVYGLVFLPKMLRVSAGKGAVQATNADRYADKHCEICLVGTGGGLLAMFFHEHFKNTVIDTIDLDEEMLKIAKDWFGFRETNRMHGYVGDGIEFVNKRVNERRSTMF